MRDRSSGSEADEEAEKIVKKRRRRRRSEMKRLGGEVIGVNVDGSRKREREREKGTETP